MPPVLSSPGAARGIKAWASSEHPNLKAEIPQGPKFEKGPYASEPCAQQPRCFLPWMFCCMPGYGATCLWKQRPSDSAISFRVFRVQGYWTSVKVQSGSILRKATEARVDLPAPKT